MVFSNHASLSVEPNINLDLHTLDQFLFKSSYQLMAQNFSLNNNGSIFAIMPPPTSSVNLSWVQYFGSNNDAFFLDEQLITPNLSNFNFNGSCAYGQNPAVLEYINGHTISQALQSRQPLQ